MNNELVSCIIPVYNVENYLEECVNSLINQTYKNIEIILINDGSKDSSPEICRKLSKKDSRIQIIDKKNNGVSSARNDGINIAKGKYITFIDADDFVEEDYVEYLLGVIKKYNSDMSLIPFPNKVLTSELSTGLEREYKDYWISGDEAIIRMLNYKIVISSWNKMYKKDILLNNNIRFDEKLSYGEGFEFVIKCFKYCTKVSIGTKKVYNYRVDNINSAMSKYKEKLVTGSLEAQDKIYKIIDNKNKKMVNAWKYSLWHTYCDCLNTMVASKNERTNYQLFKDLKRNCSSKANIVFFNSVGLKDKIKGICFFINPYYTAIIINKFRKRIFNKVEKES